MTLFKFILSSLVSFLLWIRSTLYSLKLFKIYSFNVPIIAIGNIAIGGTGKTPLTIHLSQLLSKQKIKHVIVTRGFGKKSKGTFCLEHNNKNNSFRPADVGDEPLVIFNKIKDAPVVIDSNKARGIKFAIKKFSPELIVLDDGFQSTYIAKNKDLVLIDISFDLKKYKLFPNGFLRDNIKSLNKSDHLIFSCKLNKNKKTEVFFKNFALRKGIQTSYLTFYPCLYKHSFKKNKLMAHPQKIFGYTLALCGIARPESFIASVPSFLTDTGFAKITVKDHYDYNLNQETFKQRLSQYSKKQKTKINIISTLKDYYKIIELEFIKDYDIYIVDIETRLSNEKVFLKNCLER